MKGGYIIFADDDADDLELITGFFKQYNQEVNVMEFRDGWDVMKFLEDVAIHNSQPLLMVLDINMPRLNGRETLMAIRNHPRYRHVPVVMYTTSSGAAEEEFCQLQGASLVTKPSTVEGVKQTAKVLAEFCQLQHH